MCFIDLSQLGGFVCSAICEFHNRERSSRREESEADQEFKRARYGRSGNGE